MRVLIIDDHPIICDGLAKHIEEVGSQVSASPISVTSALTLAEGITAVSADVGKPDLVFLDLNLDEKNKSVTTLERFQEANRHQVPVVVYTGLSLSEDGSVEIFRRCLNELGALTVLMKGTSLDTMLIGLPRILALEKWLSSELIEALIAAPPSPTGAPPAAPLGLSPRQWDVARGLARGLRNKEIARELNISPGNVQQITGAIYKRLGVHSRLEAAVRLSSHTKIA
jgi:two-component system, NarL family, nitrate/nitrite response regulator NarL